MGAFRLTMRTAGLAWTVVPLVAMATGAFAQTSAGMTGTTHEIISVPADCRALLPTGMRGTVQPWQSFVRLEHCDRIKRLRRLAAVLPPDQQPRFFEDIVPASRLPREIAVDMPVLRVVFPERTFFDTADSTLRPEADQIVALVAQSLRGEPPDVALFVAGHADERGDRIFNENLSIDRANAIASAIFARGVAASSIWRVGFGEDMPLVSGHAPYAWDRNRRVEFLFAARPEGIATWLAGQQVKELCQARTAAEAALCRKELSFRNGYDIDEVVTATPVRIRPRPDPRRPVSPRPNGQTKVAVTGTQPAPTSVTPNSSTTSVAPQGGRRIRIDPINNRVERTKVYL